MRESLRPGLRHELRFRVPESKTVPALYPEVSEFQVMPAVFATGFLVGLLEWACLVAIIPHLDWPDEQSVGTYIGVSHEAVTPPGFEVTVRVVLTEVDGRRLLFEVEADDGADVISRGRHERVVINRARFAERVARKAAAAAAAGSGQ